MTLADIKIAALKLMKVSYANLTAANIDEYYDDANMNDLLYQMNESINRCFDRLLNDQIAPQEIVEVEDYTTTTADGFISMDLTQITDFYRLDRVIYSNTGYYEPNHEFLLEGDTLILADKEGDYKLVYTKIMPYIEETTVDTTVIDLPGEILRLIPYFIKGELFEEEDVNLAAVAMNIFEQRLLQIKKKKERHQTKIVDVFEGYYD